MNVFDSIQKPTLLLDTERCKRNITSMVEKAKCSRVRFRPHFKTHQSVEIGSWFRQQEVEAITVSSVDMAEYFAAAGWQDITLAFTANLRQVDALSDLARRVHLGLLFESVESVTFMQDHLPAACDAWLKIDVGSHRTGLPWESADQVLAVARAFGKGGPLNLRGLLCHAGHTYTAHSPDRVVQIYHETLHHLFRLRSNLAGAGFGGLEISYGDTPTCSIVDDFNGLDEIRPGNFVFYDLTQLRVGSCAEPDLAVAVACPVVALHPDRNVIVMYGGAVHLSKDFFPEGSERIYGRIALPEGNGWGPLVPGSQVFSLSQEHGLVRLPSDVFERIQVGDLVCVLPVHSCLSVDLFHDYLTLEGQVISKFY